MMAMNNIKEKYDMLTLWCSSVTQLGGNKKLSNCT